MSQKPKRYDKRKKPRKKAQADDASAEVAEVLPPEAPDAADGGARKWPLIVCFLFGFLLYANTISFQHALDDKLSITGNSYTKAGIEGIPDILSNDLLTGFYGKKKNLLEGGRFRPLAQITFALEYEYLGPPEDEKDTEIIKEYHDSMAHFSHTVNALLYGLTGIVLYLVLLQLFPPKDDTPWYLSFPIIATLLFLAHPLHTEVVANIKSRDELFSVLGSLTATLFALKYIDQRNWLHLLLASIGLFVGLSGKETSALFLGVIPLMMVFFKKPKLKDVVIVMAVLGTVTAGYMKLRSDALGPINNTPIAEWMNDPYLFDKWGEPVDQGEKHATIVYTMGLYLKLLFVPHPLTHDYYPKHIPIIDWSDVRALGPLLIYLVLAVFAIVIGIKRLMRLRDPDDDGAWRSRDMYAFAVIHFLGTFLLFSNFFFQIGTFMNERFMYVPSIGWALMLAWFFTNDLKRIVKSPGTHRTVMMAGLVLYLGFFAGKTFMRNYAWENDTTLALADVQVSVNSAKVNMSAGGALVDMLANMENPKHKADTFALARKYLNKSMEVYPTYVPPMELTGRGMFHMEDYGAAIDWFEKCLQVNPNHKEASTNMEATGNRMRGQDQYDLAIRAFTTLLKYQPNRWQTASSLGEMYGKQMNDLPNAIKYLEMAYAIKPNEANILNNLGTAYAFTNRIDDAQRIFLESTKVKSNDPTVWNNLANTYQAQGNVAKAEECRQKAAQFSQ